MERPSSRLRVVYSAEARLELNGIFEFNLETRGEQWAIRYVSFLEKSIANLEVDYLSGIPILDQDDLRYLIMKRRTRGGGHLAVYQVAEAEVRILHIFHTKQDWRSLLST